MYKLILENEKGSQLTFNQIGGAYQITDIDGLNPPAATINTSEVALMDGQKFNSSKLQMRQLQIAFAIQPPAEINRIAIYDVVKTKQWLKILYSNNSRDVFIEGYVQSLVIDYFASKQIATLVVLCPQPYWNGAQSVVSELSQIADMFHFPFAALAEPEEAEPDEYTEYNRQLMFGYVDVTSNVEITNDGDVATGIIIELQALDAISNPKIIDYVTNDFIGLNYTMQAGDVITIDTRAGHKTVTLTRNAQQTNLFNYLMKNSTWLQLDYSGGVYIYEVGSGLAGNLAVYITHYNQYEGV